MTALLDAPPTGEPVAGLAPPSADSRPDLDPASSGRRSTVVLAAFGCAAASATIAWSRMFALDRGTILCLVAAVLAVAVSAATSRCSSSLVAASLRLVVFVLYAAAVAAPVDGVSFPTPSAVRTIIGWLPTMARTTLDVGLPGDSQGPPLLLALTLTWLASSAGAEVTLRTRARAGALVWPIGLFVVALLLGSPLPTRPLLITAPLALSAMFYLALSGRPIARGLQVPRSGGAAWSDLARQAVRKVVGRGFGVLGMVVVIAVAVAGVLPGTDGDPPSLHRVPPFEPTRFLSPLLSLYSQVTAQPSKPLFTLRSVDGSLGDRVAIAALDHFTGDTWESRRQFRPVGEFSPPDERAAGLVDVATARVEVTGLTGPWLPHAGRVDRLGVRGVQSDDPSGNFVLSDGVGSADYEIRFGSVRDRDRSVAAASPVAVDPVWTQLPDDADGGLKRAVPGAPAPCRVDDITMLGRTWTEGVRSTGSALVADLAKVTTIESKLRNGFGLDVSYGPGHSLADLCRVLGAGPSSAPHAAQSEQFAAAMAVMVRGLDLPARVMVGYHVDADADAGATVTIRESDAFAWTEVDFGDAGWIAFDPTPTAAKPDADDQTIITPQRPTPPPPTAPPTTAPPSPESTTTTTIASSEQLAATGGGWSATSTGVLAGVLVVALVVGGAAAVMAAKARRRRGRRERARPNDSVIGAWFEALDLLRDRGFAPPPHLTARELADTGSKALRLPDLRPPLVRLARLFSEAEYSRRTLDAERVTRSWQLVDEIEAELTANEHGLARLRRRVSLVSLRRSGW